MIVWSLSFSLLLALMVGLGSFSLMSRYLRESREQSARTTLSLLSGEIRTDLDEVIFFAETLCMDPQTATYLATASREEEMDLRVLSLSTWTHLSDLFNARGGSRNITRFLVSTLDGKSFLQVTVNPGTLGRDLIGRLREAPFFESHLNASGYLWDGLWDNPLTPPTYPKILPVVRPITRATSSATLGFVYLEISPDLLARHMEAASSGKDVRFFVTLGEHSYQYLPEEGFLEVPLPEGTVSLELAHRGITLSMLPSQAEQAEKWKDVLLMLIPIFAAILGAGLLLSLALRRRIAAPIDRLLLTLGRIGLGDFSRDEQIEWDNELGQIGRGINLLSSDISALMERRVQDEAERQKLRYDMLLQQVNPHFLYNTLGAIRWMAMISGSEGIAEVVTALTRLLQNISKGGEDLIPLRAELDLLKDYFTIMRYRYGGSIELSIETEDPTLLDCLICRFSLQPIVENAIFHGIVPSGGAGTIRVHIYADENLHVDVSDDGIGMDEETARKILEGEEGPADGFFRHIGLSNVHSRIVYAFGPSYGIQVHSLPGQYTTMAFTLPLKKKGEEANET